MNNIIIESNKKVTGNPTLGKEEILTDYRLANLSRQLSLTGKREVLKGHANFGVFGDGKEIAQIAYAKAFKNGDWRSGYYRDQTFMLALGLLTPEQFFAQLYGDTDEITNSSGFGRVFNNHFSTANITNDGQWKDLMQQKNSASDVSPTSAQIPKLLGLAYASKLFRNNKSLHKYSKLSLTGNEVAFGTIGESSTSEGLFFESLNAACVLQVPMAIAIWDDGYGISVPVELQTTKSSISEALKGFEKENNSNGCMIYKEKGWDYINLIKMFEEGISICRKEHIPVVFHVQEMTQPLGHSTSGSHERYKSKKRLEWEKQFDPILKMKEWIINERIATINELIPIENETVEIVKNVRDNSYQKYLEPFIKEKKEFIQLLQDMFPYENQLEKIPGYNEFIKKEISNRKAIVTFSKSVLLNVQKFNLKDKNLQKLIEWIKRLVLKGKELYNTNLYTNDSKKSALKVDSVNPVYNENSQNISGTGLLNKNFDHLFAKYPLLVIFGEDTGKIGDVNNTLKGLQEKYGELRISDTGIREASIIGQGIGLALRGIRPIAEIQYLDYVIFGLQMISDDLATTHYRTKGNQSAPLIVRTRGHRLVGIWHSGSPMGMLINSVKGMHLCVPRNMTQAAGMYNTLMEANDPAIVIEPLLGYSVKERLPDNIGEFRTPLGVPEIIQEGNDITVVTYAWCVRIAQEAIRKLEQFGISVELIDIQTLIPFDNKHTIRRSIEKTNKVLFLDEDVPGGGTAYMMQKVLEEQKAFYHLDAAPKTLTAKEHRPAYGTDGDYFSKPNAEDVFNMIYSIMSEYNHIKYPHLLFH